MQYIHGSWNHLFGFRSSPVDLRFVFDTDSNRIVAMDLSLAGAYTRALPDEIADVEDSLKNANDRVFQAPVEYGLERSSTPPEWSKLGESAHMSS